jgi:predicted RNase H-like HicB family nuclease
VTYQYEIAPPSSLEGFTHVRACTCNPIPSLFKVLSCKYYVTKERRCQEHPPSADTLCIPHLKKGGLEREFSKRRKRTGLIDLKYSLVIEATEDPNFFGFYSPDLEGFTGVGHSIEDCLYKAKWGIEEHISLLKERGLSIPEVNPNPTVVIRNESQLEHVA